LRSSFRDNAIVRVSAKADYALRAVIELAAAGAGPVKGERIAQAQEIPLKFLENILLELRHAGIVRSQRGVEGGYWLARPPEDVSLAEVIRAVEGPIANVRGVGPQDVEYGGAAGRLREVWIAVRASLRSVLEETTVADLARGELPPAVEALARDPDAWAPH
jgi:Rrf2 family protein